MLGWGLLDRVNLLDTAMAKQGQPSETKMGVEHIHPVSRTIGNSTLNRILDVL
jgi:hypothetical protein